MKDPGHGELARSVREVAAEPLLLASFSLYKAIALMLVSGLVLPRAVRVGALDVPAEIAFFGMLAVVFLLLALNMRHAGIFASRGLTARAVGCLCLGLLLAAEGVVHDGGAGSAVAIVALLAIGLAAVGLALIHTDFGCVMGYLGMSKTLRFGVFSSLIAVALCAAAGTASAPVRTGAACAGAVACAVLLERSKDRLGRTRIYQRDEMELVIPWRFMVTSFIQGLAIGTSRTALALVPVSPLLLDVGATAAACALAFAAVLVARVNFNSLIYRIGFVLMGGGMLVHALAGTSAGALGCSLLIQMCAFTFLDLVLWSFGSYLIKNRRQPAVWVASCPTASLMSGRALGCIAAIGASLLSDGGAPAASGLDATQVLASALAYGVTVAALMLSSERNIQKGWGFIKPGAPESDTVDLEHVCGVVASEHGLTPRETEILQRIVAGRTRTQIAAELCVAPNTVKTHAHSLYAKLGVHARTELVAFVERRRRLYDLPDE